MPLSLYSLETKDALRASFSFTSIIIYRKPLSIAKDEVYMTDTDNSATVALIKSIVQNMSGVTEWDSVSMILTFDGKRFSGASGYAYPASGEIVATAARPSAVRPFIDAYMQGYYKPEDTYPVKLLVQFDRLSGNYSITFEDTDEARWKVTPRNLNEMREALRPNFDTKEEGR